MMGLMTKLVGLAFLLLCSSVHAGWVQFAESGGAEGARATYYDPVTVVQLPNGKVSVWEKDVHSSAAAIEERKAYGLSTARFENFSHTLQRVIIDCRLKQYAVASIKDYSSYGEILDIIDKPSSEWHFKDIIPGGTTEIIMKRVCELN